MTFGEKLYLASTLFGNKCSSFIIVGENLILTSGSIEEAMAMNKEKFESLSEHFHITDDYIGKLNDLYREAFDIVVHMNNSTFYIAGVWQARVFITLSVVNNLHHGLKWLPNRENHLLCQLAWCNPMDEHDVGVCANQLFGGDIYRIYDIMPYYGPLTDWDKDIIVDLIRKRYIEINMIPINVLESIGDTVNECDLMEQDIVKLFNCKMDITSARVRDLKVSEIAKARILAMRAFEAEMKKLLPNEGDDSDEVDEYVKQDEE